MSVVFLLRILTRWTFEKNDIEEKFFRIDISDRSSKFYSGRNLICITNFKPNLSSGRIWIFRKNEPIQKLKIEYNVYV